MEDLDTTVNETTNKVELDFDLGALDSATWGRLVSVNPLNPHIEIQEDECLFGRSHDCHYKLTDKKISSKHCRLYRKKQETDEHGDYHFFLDDYSSNGTFVNRKRVGKGNTISIVNGNEIALTTNIDPQDTSRLLYIFQDLEKLRREQREEEEANKVNQDDSSGFTQVDNDLISDLDEPISPIKKSISNLSNNSDDSLLKKQLSSSINNNNNNNSNSNTSMPDLTSTPPLSSINNNNNDDNITLPSPVKKMTSTTTLSTKDTNNNNNSNTGDVMVIDKPTTPIVENKLKRKSSDLTTSTPLTTTTINVNSNNDNKQQEEEKEEKDKNNISSSIAVDNTKTKKSKIDLEETMGENLICGICQEIIYKCITLVPCMHNFCTCCYGNWRANANDCPQCRTVVKLGQKNHAINNLIEIYLQKNPEKRRDPEELADMDKTSKITDEMLNKGVLNKSKKKYDDYDEDDYSDEYDEEEDYSDEDDYNNHHHNHNNQNYHNQYAQTYPPFIPPFQVCMCCTAQGPNGYQCPPVNPPHHICSTCAQPFPKEVPEPRGIRCEFCTRTNCQLYRTAANPAPHVSKFGLLSTFEPLFIPANAFLGNQFEAKVMMDYSVKSGKTLNDIYKEIIQQIDETKINLTAPIRRIVPTVPPTAPPKYADTYACDYCMKEVFAQGLFYYRKSIPKDDLPDSGKRDDCYYGKNCRTQFNKPDHAKRFNHVCDQTKY